MYTGGTPTASISVYEFFDERGADSLQGGMLGPSEEQVVVRRRNVIVVYRREATAPDQEHAIRAAVKGVPEG